MTERTHNAPELPALAVLREGLLDAARRDTAPAQPRRRWPAAALAALCRRRRSAPRALR